MQGLKSRCTGTVQMFSSKHPLVMVFDVALSNQLSRIRLTEEIAKLGRGI